MHQGCGSTSPSGDWTNSGSKLSGLVDSVSLIALWRISVAAIAENSSVSRLKASGSTPRSGHTHSSGGIETGPATTAATAPSSMESDVARGCGSVGDLARSLIHCPSRSNDMA